MGVHRSRGRPRRLVRRLALAATSLFALGIVLEGGLRLGGFGVPATFFVPDDAPGMVRANERFAWRFMPPELARAPVPVRIAVRKPPGTTRVFLLGSSAAQGFPDPAYGVGRFLETMLRADPTARVEVVNVALTAVNSHVVRVIADECARYEPDVFLVYCGNNEAIGPYGPGTVFAPFQRSGALLRLHALFTGTRTFQMARRLARMLHPSGGPRWNGLEMFAGANVAADDPRMPALRAHFRANLDAICAAADRAGARVLLCTVPVNLRDCPPFAPTNRLGGATADDLFAAGRFQEACDADGLRLRADSGIQAVIRAVAADRRATLVDLAAALDGGDDFLEHVHLSPEGCWRAAALIHRAWTGREPPAFETCRGALALTPFDRRRILAAATGLRARPPFTAQSGHAERRLADVRGLAALEASLSPAVAAAARSEYEAAAAARPDDAFVAEAFARFLGERGDAAGSLVQWRRVAALRPWDRGTRLQLAMATGAAGDPAAAIEMIRSGIADRLGDPAVCKAAGDLIVQLGDAGGAMREYREALRLRPDYADAMSNLGALLMRAGPAGAEEAERWLRRAIELEDGGLAHASLATLLLRSGRMKEALPHLDRALLERPADAALLNNRGVALAALGRRDEAIASFAAALRIDPGHAGARQALVRLRGAG